jgi:hypothetical protein
MARNRKCDFMVCLGFCTTKESEIIDVMQGHEPLIG